MQDTKTADSPTLTGWVQVESDSNLQPPLSPKSQKSPDFESAISAPMERKYVISAGNDNVSGTTISTTPIRITMTRPEYELVWDFVQKQPISPCPPFSPDERTDIVKAAKTVMDAKGKVPLLFFIARFESAEMLVYRPYHFRVLAHVVDFDSATDTECELFLALINKYRRMDDFKKFADYFERVYQDWKKTKEVVSVAVEVSSKKVNQEKPATEMIPKIVETPVSQSTSQKLTIVQIIERIKHECPPTGSWEREDMAKIEAFADKLRPECGPIMLDDVIQARSMIGGDNLCCFFNLVDLKIVPKIEFANFYTKMEDWSGKKALSYFQERYEKKKLTLAEVIERIKQECPSSSSWEREHMAKVEAVANAIRPEAHPVSLNDVLSTWEDSHTIRSGDDMLCLFNVVDLKTVSQTQFDAFIGQMSTQAGSHTLAYFRNQYAVAKESSGISNDNTPTPTSPPQTTTTLQKKKLTIAEIWARIKKECPNAPSWEDSDMAKIEKYADSIRPECGPVTLADVCNHSSDNVDHHCCLFNLVDLTTVAKNDFDMFKVSFGNKSQAYFDRRYFEVNRLTFSFADMSRTMIKATIMKEKPNARDWSTESMRQIELCADRLIEKHGQMAWQQFDLFQDNCTSVNHLCLGFNLVEFKSANVKGIESFIQSQCEKYMTSCGDYLKTRYQVICKQLVPQENMGQKIIPKMEIDNPKQSNPEKESRPPISFESLKDLLSCGPANNGWHDKSQINEWVEFAKSVETKIGKISLEQYEQFAVYVGDNQIGLKCQRLAWIMVDFHGVERTKIFELLGKLNYNNNFVSFAMKQYELGIKETPIASKPRPVLTWEEIQALIKTAERTGDWSVESRKKLETFADTIRPQIGSITLDQFTEFRLKLHNVDYDFVAWCLVDFASVSEKQIVDILEPRDESFRAWCFEYYNEWKSKKLNQSQQCQLKTPQPEKPNTTILLNTINPSIQPNPSTLYPPLSKEDIFKLVDEKMPESKSWSDEDCKKLADYAETLRPRIGFVPFEYVTASRAASQFNRAYVLFNLVDFRLVSKQDIDKFSKMGDSNSRLRWTSRYEFHLANQQKENGGKSVLHVEKSEKTVNVEKSAKSASSESTPIPTPTNTHYPTKMDIHAIWDLLFTKCPHTTVSDACTSKQIERSANVANEVRLQTGLVSVEDLITVEKTYGQTDKASTCAFVALLHLVDIANSTAESRQRLFDMYQSQELLRVIGNLFVTLALKNVGESRPTRISSTPSPSPSPSRLNWIEIVDLIKQCPTTLNWESKEMAKLEVYANQIRPKTGSLTLAEFVKFTTTSGHSDEDCVAWNLVDFSNVTESDVQKTIGSNPNHSVRDYAMGVYKKGKGVVRKVVEEKNNAAVLVVPSSNTVLPSTTPSNITPTLSKPKMEWTEIKKLIKKYPSTPDWSDESKKTLEKYANEIRPRTGLITLDQWKMVKTEDGRGDPCYVAWNLVDFTNVSQMNVAEMMDNVTSIEFIQWAKDYYNRHNHDQVQNVDLASMNFSTALISELQSVCRQSLDRFTLDQRRTIWIRLSNLGFTKTSYAYLDHLKEKNDKNDHSSLSLMDGYILAKVVQWTQKDKAIVTEIIRLCRANQWDSLVELLLDCLNNVFSSKQIAKWHMQFIYPNVSVNTMTKAWRKVERLF